MKLENTCFYVSHVFGHDLQEGRMERGEATR